MTRPNQPLKPEASRVRSRVIGCLEDGFITVLMGAGYGQLDGGVPTPIPAARIPPHLRMPNTELYLIIQHGQIISVEPDSDDNAA